MFQNEPAFFLQKGKERLNEALEAIKALVEPVEPPKDTIAHIRYFCGKNTENADELKDTEQGGLLFTN